MISGTISYWINVGVAALAIIVAGGPHMFPDYVPALWATAIVQTAAFAVAIATGVNAYLHQAGGPGVSAPAVKALAILAFCILAVSSIGTARAAGNPLNAIGDWAASDVDAGIVAATKYPNLQDKVGATCGANIKTLASMFKDHPLPLTAKFWSDIEYARLIQGELNAICRVPECAQVWADMANAAKALQVIPLPISFTSICSRVPIVGLGN